MPRLRVKKASLELTEVFEKIVKKINSEKETGTLEMESPFAEITDDDIDSLFAD